MWGKGNMDKHPEVTDPIVKRVAVGIALKGHTPPESYHDRMLQMFYMGTREAEQKYKEEIPRYEFMHFHIGEVFIPFAREQLAQYALDNNCHYLYMIDDDMLGPMDMFYSLVKHKVDLVAPLAFTRNSPHYPVIYECVSGWDKVSKSEYFINRWISNYPRNTLFRCDAVGFGAVLINTDIFRKMERPWFMGSHGSGEDIQFCYRAGKLGFKIWADTSVKLGHLSKPIVVTEEYVDQIRGMTEEERNKFYGQYEKYKNFEVAKP